MKCHDALPPPSFCAGSPLISSPATDPWQGEPRAGAGRFISATQTPRSRAEASRSKPTPEGWSDGGMEREMGGFIG